MTHEQLVNAAAAAALLGLMAYALLGGADFGGGVWDLFAAGPRKRAQRTAIRHAMGPVWEANHVWLIFVIVVLFTCFPRGYAPLSVALFAPFHLALLGIMLRGAAFVFRGAASDGPSPWGVVFGVASTISPVLLGVAFGVVTEGNIRIDADGEISVMPRGHWLTAYAFACGLLALAACAYLAAVYLAVETEGDLREDFRQRAIWAGTATAGLAFIVLGLGVQEAGWFVRELTKARALPVLSAGLLCFGLSAWAVFNRRYRLSQIFAAGEIILLLLGWGLAQHPYLIYPDVTLFAAAAPAPTIRFLLWTIPIGASLLVPSLWLLFRVFKTERS
jgi:cytochrome d ubiquinol oxidase subunit II